MTSNEKAIDFLERHGMTPESVDPDVYIYRMLSEMKAGLAGEKCSMDMIPTYLSNDGVLEPGVQAAVIDAGGTNFRSALVHFQPGGYTVTDMIKRKMPGTDAPCTWEEFIRFTADAIEPLMDRADAIGFCFSYAATITPERDGRVITIDKEVVVTGCEGQLVGASLLQELERRGITGKHIVILNDTVAVLLGMAAGLDKSRYSGFIGQVSGTGTNTCVSLPVSAVGKLGLEGDKGVIINLESGKYDGIQGGDFDRLLDEHSHNPGQKHFEKLTAGVYLGEICHLMLNAAADEGLLSDECAGKVRALPVFDSAVLDAWACGEGFDILGGNEDDHSFAQTLSLALFQRSARCMCVNLLAGRGLACAEGPLLPPGAGAPAAALRHGKARHRPRAARGGGDHPARLRGGGAAEYLRP